MPSAYTKARRPSNVGRVERYQSWIASPPWDSEAVLQAIEGTATNTLSLGTQGGDCRRQSFDSRDKQRLSGCSAAQQCHRRDRTCGGRSSGHRSFGPNLGFRPDRRRDSNHRLGHEIVLRQPIVTRHKFAGRQRFLRQTVIGVVPGARKGMHQLVRQHSSHGLAQVDLALRIGVESSPLGR